VEDRGFFITLQAVRRQLTAMPHELYLIRLIHHPTRKAFPGERLWTAAQLLSVATLRFLRVRNREGCDVYIQPYAGDQNAGYILVDLDSADPTVVEVMRAYGHDPCVVLETSPDHWQAWIRLSASPLQPAMATAIGKQLARAYGGDLASSDWRHLGRLAGFTNQKPQRRTPAGYAPWVKIVHARVGLAPTADALLQSVRSLAGPPWLSAQRTDTALRSGAHAAFQEAAPTSVAAAEANRIYRDCVQRWRIRERFPQPDWSIVDLWVARHLLSHGMQATRVQDILRLASPSFPRRHGDPDDYLHRTIARAAFPCRAPARPVCAGHA
jgi:RepB DNA-primase from phage plasmid